MGSCARVSVAAIGTRLAALSGVEIVATLSAWFDVGVGDCRTLSPVAAAVLSVPFKLGDGGEIPIRFVATHADRLLVACNPVKR